MSTTDFEKIPFLNDCHDRLTKYINTINELNQNELDEEMVN